MSSTVRQSSAQVLEPERERSAQNTSAKTARCGSPAGAPAMSNSRTCIGKRCSGAMPVSVAGTGSGVTALGSSAGGSTSSRVSGGFDSRSLVPFT